MKLIFWENRVKPHFVPDDLVAELRADICTRFNTVVADIAPRLAGDVIRLDLGGPMMVDAEWVGVDLDGVVFEVPVRDVSQLYLELLQAPARGRGTQGYYKLHGWIHALVLTPNQRNYVLATWARRLQEFHDKAEKEATEYRRRVAEINRHPGVELSVPALDIERHGLN